METEHFNKVKEYEDEGLIHIDTHIEDNEVEVNFNIPDTKEEEPSINLEKFKTLVKNNPLVMKNLISMTIESFYLYKKDFKSLLEKRDQKEVGLLTHKLKLTSNILGAYKLEESIKLAREILAESPENILQLQQAILNIQWEFDQCIKELQIEMDKIST